MAHVSKRDWDYPGLTCLNTRFFGNGSLMLTLVGDAFSIQLTDTFFEIFGIQLLQEVHHAYGTPLLQVIRLPWAPVQARKIGNWLWACWTRWRERRSHPTSSPMDARTLLLGTRWGIWTFRGWGRFEVLEEEGRGLNRIVPSPFRRPRILFKGSVTSWKGQNVII